jgi:hypothetical protein
METDGSCHCRAYTCLDWGGSKHASCIGCVNADMRAVVLSQGLDVKGYNKDGFDLEGFNKDGRDKCGYDKEGFSKDGFDRDGYDKEGFDKHGYDKVSCLLGLVGFHALAA